MTSFDSINSNINNISNIIEFNDYLVNSNKNIKIQDYTDYVRNNDIIRIKFDNVLIEKFIDYSISINNKQNEFCVNMKDTLIMLGIKNENVKINDLKITLERSKMSKENGDFILLGHVPQQVSTSHGGNNKIDIMLKPITLKKVLLDLYDHNQRLNFIEFYIFLENIMYNYNDYQVQL
jgi:hypothetical protein